MPKGFIAERIATVARARELSVAPNGDLFVGTSGDTIDVIPDAQDDARAPEAFATFDDRPVAGVFVTNDTVYAGAQFGVYRIPYRAGDRKARAKPEKIATVRTSGVSRDHVTTTVALANGVLYASVGSSCNACDPELDATRATIQSMTPEGKNVHPRAVDIRNAIALAVQPGTNDFWAGVAGRDDLEPGHPYEIFDDVSAHAGTPDYGWLKCYDDRKPIAHASCANVVVPAAVFPAYLTPIGAVFYPQRPRRAATRFRRSIAAARSSRCTDRGIRRCARRASRSCRSRALGPHATSTGRIRTRSGASSCPAVRARDGERTCRPTGVAVGTDGSLFVSEDEDGAIYRIRPAR